MPSIADFVAAVAARIPSVRVVFGREYQDENAGPPQAVFMPTPDRFGPPRQTNNTRPARYYPPIQTRFVGLEVRIWAAAAEGADQSTYPDIRATEALLNLVCDACWYAAAGCMTFESGDWLPGGTSHLGRTYILQIRVEIPVVKDLADGKQTYATFTDVDSMQMSVLNKTHNPPP